MSGFFKCANCEKETRVRGGHISLICQNCGCGDITFDTDVELQHVNYGEVSDPILIKAGEPFFGIRRSGFVWDVSFPGKDTVVDATLTEDPPALLKRKRK